MFSGEHRINIHKRRGGGENNKYNKDNKELEWEWSVVVCLSQERQARRASAASDLIGAHGPPISKCERKVYSVHI